MEREAASASGHDRPGIAPGYSAEAIAGESPLRLGTTHVGALIEGGGGTRKIRVGVGSRGKRGGARMIYYWAVRKDMIPLLTRYPPLPDSNHQRLIGKVSPKCGL